MNKKTFNRFDPFMPIKVNPNSSEIDSIDKNFEMIDEFDSSLVLNESLKFRTPQIKKDFAIVISRKAIGNENGLGEKLLEDFIYSFYDSFEIPQYLIFMNEGIFLLENQNVLRTIKYLSKYKAKVLASLESIEHFNIKNINKSIIQATSGDIADKILISNKLISI